MATLPHAPFVQLLQQEGAEHAHAANTHTGAALRATLAGDHTTAAVQRILARAHRDRLRVVAHARHAVVVAAWAGFLADGADA